ncbi:hypothetical protein AOG28_08840 [Cobetia sp. UCD-24C]|nr:hypothetical protein AOG28_08840 [Cobetia sp. UCD-24C]
MSLSNRRVEAEIDRGLAGIDKGLEIETLEIGTSEIGLETQKASHHDWPFASELRVKITRLA